jgi:hypothetical protein
MSNFSQLVSYFEALARQHKDIRHSDAQKHFFRMELDEVMDGVNRTDVAFPMLVLEGYSFDFTDQRSDNPIKNRRGAFLLIDHVSDQSDFNRIESVWDRMEAIGDDILRRIKADKRNPAAPAVRGFDLDSVEALLLAAELNGNYGIRFTYTISSPLDQSENSGVWLEE